MTQLPSSSRVNTTKAPCWLLHAVTWEWRSTVVLTRWIWTPQRLACHSANHSILFRDTIWSSWLCAGKDARGAAACQPTFSCCSFSYFSLCNHTLRGAFEEGNVLSWEIQSCDQTCSVLWNNSTFWHFHCLLLDLWLSASLYIHVTVFSPHSSEICSFYAQYFTL